MFVAPASGIATAFAFIRSFIRQNFGLGNFYVDFTRIILTLLLPVAIVSSLVLMAIGVLQTLDSHIKYRTLENTLTYSNTLFNNKTVQHSQNIITNVKTHKNNNNNNNNKHRTCCII
ncbi:MAG TPA: potassium-transporting ATPase subunit KdpA [Verrucomicrobiae bacterium]|nr:potassium-transporting ATPase subunit KdpA [Verrucomicrobiae bacterium]